MFELLIARKVCLIKHKIKFNRISQIDSKNVHQIHIVKIIERVLPKVIKWSNLIYKIYINRRMHTDIFMYYKTATPSYRKLAVYKEQDILSKPNNIITLP